jgi:hypothetical protein
VVGFAVSQVGFVTVVPRLRYGELKSITNKQWLLPVVGLRDGASITNKWWLVTVVASACTVH